MSYLPYVVKISFAKSTEPFVVYIVYCNTVHLIPKDLPYFLDLEY